MVIEGIPASAQRGPHRGLLTAVEVALSGMLRSLPSGSLEITLRDSAVAPIECSKSTQRPHGPAALPPGRRVA